MPVNINSLEWDASINTDKFDQELKNMEQQLQRSVETIGKSAGKMGTGLDAVMDHVHDAAESASDAMGQVVKGADALTKAAGNAIPTWKELNALFHGVFAQKFGHGEGMKVMSDWNKQMKEGKLSFEEFVKRLNLTDDEMAKVNAKISKFAADGSAAFRSVGQEAANAATSVGKIPPIQPKVETRSLNDLNAKLDALKQKYFALSAAERQSNIGKALAKNIREAESEIRKINSEITQTENLARKAAGAIGAYFSLQAAQGFVGEMIRVRSEFESLEVSFNVLLKSKEKADALMAQVVELAATTPFQLQDVAKGAKQLLALGVEASKVTDLLKRMGDIAAGGGVEIDRIIRAYGQVKALGRVRNEELLQLAEAGVPIYKELSKVLGVAEDKVGELVNTGTVGFDKLHKVILSLTDQGGMFAGMMEAQSKTLGGQISNLRDSWAQLLNDLAKSNEGVLKGGVSIASTLIDNYEAVINTVKVLIATYGTYRAALMLTTVASTTLGASTKSLTALQIIQAGATGVAQKAMAFLNRTILANPAVAIATAIGTLVAALVVFGKRAEEAGAKARILADVQKKVADSMSETEAKIRPYMEALQKANLSEQERVNIYNKLREIDPKIVEGLDAKTLSYEKLKNNVDNYINALREQYRVEASQEAIQNSIKEENRIKEQIKLQEDLIAKKQKNNTAGLNKVTIGGAAPAVQTNTVKADQERLAELKRFLHDQETLTSELGKALAVPEVKPKNGQKTLKDYLEDQENLLTKYGEYIKLVKNKSQAEEVQKALVAKMESFAPGDRAKDAYKKKIQEVNDLIKKYAIEGPKSAKTQEATENKINGLLEARKGILEAIADAQAKAAQTGMGKQASEIDKINERYDDLIDRVDKYNREVALWNKRNPKNQVQGVGRIEVDKINAARQLEINNQLMKEDVANYQKSLKEKSDLYKQYQQTVSEVGKADADKLYDKEKLAFDNYLDYLRFEMGKFGTKIALGVELNFADKEKMKQLAESMKAVSKEMAEQQMADTKRVMVATMNAAEQRKVIEANYLKEVEILRKTYKGEELKQREQVLKEALDNDLRSLAQHLGEQTGMYRAMNKEIYKLANERIDNEIKLLEAQLEGLKDSDPGLAAAIKEAIKRWKELQAQMNGSLTTFEKIDQMAGTVSNGFADLAQSVGGMNEALAASLQLVADLSSGIGKAAKSYQQFKDSQNMIDQATGKMTMQGVMGSISGSLGMFSALVGIIQTIDNIGKKRRDSDRAFRKEQEEALGRIQVGEAEINLLYRERERSQVLLNKLRIEGLEAEKRLLEEQAKQINEQYLTVFQQLGAVNPLNGLNLAGMTNQQSDELFKQMGAVWQNGIMTSMGSLANLSFKKLEELYIQGVLTDRAKELFEILQKLKAEGADIDKMLADAKKATQELFTATTTDSIADSIVQGFKAGKRTIKDFADDFQQLMQAALLNALKYQTLEKPLKEFYDQFASAAQSDGALTQSEIADLQKIYNDLIIAAGKQFEDLQKVTGVNMSGGGSGTNSLQGAIKGMTQETAELLAGQFAGQRIATLELLKVAQTNLSIQTRIQNNTGISAQKLTDLMDKLNRLTNGTEVLHTKTR